MAFFLLHKWATLFALSTILCEDPKCSYTFHQDVLPFWGLVSPEQPLLQIPGVGFLYQAGQALELELKVVRH